MIHLVVSAIQKIVDDGLEQNFDDASLFPHSPHRPQASTDSLRLLLHAKSNFSAIPKIIGNYALNIKLFVIPELIYQLLK